MGVSHGWEAKPGTKGPTKKSISPNLRSVANFLAAHHWKLDFWKTMQISVQLYMSWPRTWHGIDPYTGETCLLKINRQVDESQYIPLSLRFFSRFPVVLLCLMMFNAEFQQISGSSGTLIPFPTSATRCSLWEEQVEAAVLSWRSWRKIHIWFMPCRTCGLIWGWTSRTSCQGELARSSPYNGRFIDLSKERLGCKRRKTETAVGNFPPLQILVLVLRWLLRYRWQVLATWDKKCTKNPPGPLRST